MSKGPDGQDLAQIDKWNDEGGSVSDEEKTYKALLEEEGYSRTVIHQERYTVYEAYRHRGKKEYAIVIDGVRRGNFTLDELDHLKDLFVDIKFQKGRGV